MSKDTKDQLSLTSEAIQYSLERVLEDVVRDRNTIPILVDGLVKFNTMIKSSKAARTRIPCKVGSVYLNIRSAKRQTPVGAGQFEIPVAKTEWLESYSELPNVDKDFNVWLDNQDPRGQTQVVFTGGELKGGFGVDVEMPHLRESRIEPNFYRSNKLAAGAIALTSTMLSSRDWESLGLRSRMFALLKDPFTNKVPSEEHDWVRRLFRQGPYGAEEPTLYDQLKGVYTDNRNLIDKQMQNSVKDLLNMPYMIRVATPRLVWYCNDIQERLIRPIGDICLVETVLGTILVSDLFNPADINDISDYCRNLDLNADSQITFDESNRTKIIRPYIQSSETGIVNDARLMMKLFGEKLNDIGGLRRSPN